MPQRVFFFGDGKAEGTRDMRDALGGKGANLAEMTNLKLPVPPGFAMPRGQCCVYIFHLTVYDRTSRPCGVSYATSDWPVKICNDLPPN